MILTKISGRGRKRARGVYKFNSNIIILLWLFYRGNNILSIGRRCSARQVQEVAIAAITRVTAQIPLRFRPVTIASATHSRQLSTVRRRASFSPSLRKKTDRQFAVRVVKCNAGKHDDNVSRYAKIAVIVSVKGQRTTRPTVNCLRRRADRKDIQETFLRGLSSPAA